MIGHRTDKAEVWGVGRRGRGVLLVGLDIKGLNTLILATPRSDVVQASGRIQRDISPLFVKKIIDVYDKFSVFTRLFNFCFIKEYPYLFTKILFLT